MADTEHRISEYLRVTATVRVPLYELDWRVDTSGGPGGQHANRSRTRVEVRLNLETSSAFGPRQRARVIERLGPVASAIAGDARSQHRNREVALDRLRQRLATALHVEPPRVPTKPSKAAKARRLNAKKHNSDRKRNRQTRNDDD